MDDNEDGEELPPPLVRDLASFPRQRSTDPGDCR